MTDLPRFLNTMGGKRAEFTDGASHGGKSPNVIFADARLPEAVNGAISGIFAASGQTCIAGSRLLVERRAHDEVVERLVKLAKTARICDPKLAETKVGPVTTLQQRDRILGYMALAREAGAECVLGGETPNDPRLGDGWFVEPTIFGGFKRSGLGRENGHEAIDGYLQTKTVWIDTTGQVANPFVIR